MHVSAVPASAVSRRLARGRVLAAAVLLLALAASPVRAATPVTYQDHVYSSSAGAASADKPQSKLWFNDGSWWALMVNAAGTVDVFELDRTTHTWRDTGTVVDSRASSTADALFSGGKLWVASRTGGSAGQVRVSRFSYSPSSRGYTREASVAAFPGGGTESVTIDKDTTGTLWVTFTRASAVFVARTTNATENVWGAPFRIAGADTAVAADDISAVVAFEGKIGVMWSDQASVATRFAYHVDGAPDSAWTVETPLSGGQLADDHLNLKSLQGDDLGRLYAVVKTSKTVSTDPVLLVLTRTARGTWSASPTATVADKMTRPQLALDKTNRVMYVMQSTEGGGSVYYKTAPLGDRPTFPSGRGAPFITWSGAKINDVSTTKDPVTSSTGLVAIATDSVARRYYHAELSLGAGTPPPPPTSEIVLAPVADTMVKEQFPETTSGAATSLVVDRQDVNGTAGTAVHSYLRFEVPPLGAGQSLESARLSLQVTNGTGNGPAVWRTSDDWSESGMTWAAGRPARDGTTSVGDFGSVAVGRASTGVTGIAGGQSVSFELVPDSSDGMDFASREAVASARPQLVLTVTTG